MVGKASNDSRVLVIGVAYKGDVGNVRESSALDVIHLLPQRGAEMTFHDSRMSSVRLDGYSLPSIELTANRAVVVTDLLVYDWEWITANSRLIVHTRNAIRASCSARIVRLWSKSDNLYTCK